MLKRTELVYKLVRDGLSDEATPLERLAIFKEIDKLLDKLTRMIRLDGGNSEAAAEVLGGPVLVQGTSRFTIEV